MMTLESGTDLLRVLGEPARVRLLHLLADEELTVAELTEATRLSQSRVSTHLGRLREAGMVRDRRQGPAAYYALNDAGMSDEAARLWSIVREGTDDPLIQRDRERVRTLRRASGRSWADSVAGQMDRHYSPGRTWEAALRGLLGLVRLGRVLDVASGDGALAELIAPRAHSVHCLDVSRRVVEAGRKRLAHLPGVHFQQGDMHVLPFDDDAFDQVLLMNALSYSEQPEAVLAEAVRVLRPGGSLALVVLQAHDERERVAEYGHVQAGFRPEELRASLLELGLDVSLCEVTSRERRSPHFEVVTAHASRPAGEPA